ncbi:TAXI family TRAP transporter solute-binding subunit [Candidatus Thiosymbion oneisti]|uniref:TAXI family TRAP transporter solute-binding subunit n=1 Tax=Candidatus Thiosymbion oneisti TaxID=589554 RepID=UPI00105E0BFC|nr:TAXI family TRAP transporter solute-binding subunit [Candidatus Thiosymbion oneisti]
MKIMKFSRYLFILLFTVGNARAELTMMTGPKDGSYYSVGKAIAGLLVEKTPVNVEESKGSVENIYKLIKKDCDLAIVQSDILHRAKDPKSDDDRLEFSDNKNEIVSLLALYPEYIQILVGKKTRIRKLRKLNGRKLYIGLPDSGTRYNATDLLEVSGIKYEDVKSVDDLTSDSAKEIAYPHLEAGEKYLTTPAALELLQKGHLDAVFSTSGGFIEKEGLRHLSIRKELVNKLKRRFEYYSLASVEIPEKGTVPLLFTRANLIARSPKSHQGLSNKDAKYIVEQIHKKQSSLDRDVSADLDFFFEDRLVRRITNNIHPGAAEYFRSQNMLPHIRFWEYVIIAMSIFIGMVIIFARVLRNTNFVARLLRTRPVTYLYTQHSWFKMTWDAFLKLTCATTVRILTWLFAITFIGAIYFIRFLEKEHSIAKDVENPFSSIEFLDSAVWLLTFAITGFSQDIYPNTLSAKVLAVLIPILGILLTFFIVVNRTFSADREIERQAQGISIPRFKNHVVICGWNDRVPNLLKDLVSTASPLPANGRVVVIAEHDAEKPLEGLGLEGKRVAYVRGRSSDYEILRKVGIERALGAIVVAGQNKIANNNYRSILTCVAIRDNLSLPPNERTGKEGFRLDDFPIIAELYYEKNRQLFESSGVNKLVSLKSISMRMVSHAALNPGISQLLLHLLKFSTSQIIRNIKATELENGKLSLEVVDQTFADMLRMLRRHDMLLLGVYEQGKERKHNTKSIEIEFREDSPYHFGTEADYRIKQTDLLILVHRNKKVPNGNKVFLRDQPPIMFNYAAEVVLLIGNNIAGKEIAEILSKRAKRVTQLIPYRIKSGNNGGEIHGIKEESNGGYTVFRTSQQLDAQFFREYHDKFSDVTRAVILGPDRQGAETNSEIFQDDQTIMYAKVLRDVAGEVFASVKHFHILAEMRCDENLDLFLHSGIDQPVPTNTLIEHCLAQMVFNRGIVSELFLKAMSYSDANKKGRLERVSAAGLSKYVGQKICDSNYDELLDLCIDKEIQLVAIQPAKGKQIIVNPTDSEEKSYRLNRDDFIFVFINPSEHSG